MPFVRWNGCLVKPFCARFAQLYKVNTEKVKIKSTLEQAMKAQRGSTSIAQLYTFFNFGARWGWMGR